MGGDPAFPLEEVLLRPAATLTLAAALPALLVRALAALLVVRGGADDLAALRAGARVLGTALVALFALAGATALGPSLVARSLGAVSLGFGLLTAALAGAATRVATTRLAAAPTVGTHSASTDAPTPARAAPDAVATRRAHAAGLVAGGALAVAVSAAAWGGDHATRLDAAELSSAPEDAAQLRARVDPWDGRAMLARAWGARRAGALGEARARLEASARMGADEAERLELDAELLAAAGRCDEAERRFGEALTARARRALAEVPLGHLELGGVHLPPTLGTRCRPARTLEPDDGVTP